ncbi:MAG: hypothetical protein R2681_00900 [Pyrinomonadaceae bacterium]
MEMNIFTKQKCYKRNHRSAFVIFLIFAILAGSTLGQAIEEVECKDAPKPEKKAPSPQKPVPPVPAAFFVPEPGFDSDKKTEDISEKSITAHPKVYVSINVCKGNVKINGWERDEVRAFVEGGSKIDFKVRERGGDEQLPVWIEVIGVAKNEYSVRGRSRSRTGTAVTIAPNPGCVSGETVELDVPRNASVKVKSLVSETSIDTVRWADVENSGGNIFLNRISSGAKAQTYRGNVTIKESGGKMTMVTTSGDIVAYKTESNEIGDFLKAKSQGGSVTLQTIGQRDVEASSVSGSINYIGKIANYGKYSFSSSYGVIGLAVAPDTSCRFTASYGGGFSSELPILDIRKERFGETTSLSGRIGDGNCNLSFKTFNGSIVIKKLLREKPEIAGSVFPSEKFIPALRFTPNRSQ